MNDCFVGKSITQRTRIMILCSEQDGLEVLGGTVVSKDLFSGDRRLSKRNVEIRFCEGVKDDFRDGVVTVEEGFLDRIPFLSVVEMDHTVKHVGVTPALEKLLHRNGVLIRGKFDTYAEEFARKYRLRFVPSNIHLATVFNGHETTIATLRIFNDGTADIHLNDVCCGSSAGSIGGGEVCRDIKWNFFMDPKAQELVAGKCYRYCTDEVLKNKDLTAFIEAACRKYKTDKHSKLMLRF